MAEEFLSDRADSSNLPPSDLPFSRGDRESVRLIVVGSRAGVITMIHMLHLKAIAKADEWSELQPEPMTGKWMSVVTKYIRLE
jgi:hypothetical protein